MNEYATTFKVLAKDLSTVEEYAKLAGEIAMDARREGDKDYFRRGFEDGKESIRREIKDILGIYDDIDNAIRQAGEI